MYRWVYKWDGNDVPKNDFAIGGNSIDLCYLKLYPMEESSGRSYNGYFFIMSYVSNQAILSTGGRNPVIGFKDY